MSKSVGRALADKQITALSHQDHHLYHHLKSLRPKDTESVRVRQPPPVQDARFGWSVYCSKVSVRLVIPFLSFNTSCKNEVDRFWL